jgi:hypothetical protein
MFTLHYLKRYKNKKVMIVTHYNILKRTMHRATNAYHYIGTKLVPSRSLNTINKRYLPDKGYKGYNINSLKKGKDPITGHNIYDTTGCEVPQHEKAHIIVRDNATGLDVAVLTSAKDPQKGNLLLAPENYKGDTLPNGKPKPQFIRSFEQPRYSKESSAYQEDTAATAFLQKYDKETNDFVKKSGTYKKVSLYRTTKDASNLYHPNGKPIYDDNGKEIDYDN